MSSNADLFRLVITMAEIIILVIMLIAGLPLILVSIPFVIYAIMDFIGKV